MPHYFSPFFFIVTILCITSVAQASSFCTSKHLSKMESLICSDFNLKHLDETLNNTYKATRHAVSNKHGLMDKQRKWLRLVRNKCRNEECLRDSYQERIAELSEIFVRSVHVSEQPLRNKEAKKICKTMANLADNSRLIALAISGRDISSVDEKAIKAGWGITDAEKEKLASFRSYLFWFTDPNTVYKFRLKQKSPLVRFASFRTGGTCVSHQIVNIPYLLNSVGENADVDNEPNPDDEMGWAHRGNEEYPVFYHGRTFIVTGNMPEIISWIKPDGRIRPLCLLKTQSIEKAVVLAKNKKLCSGIAKGTILPLKWRLITQNLPFKHDTKGYNNEFVKRYGSYAGWVGLLNIDINADGVSENIGEFVDESSAGCGYRKIWLSVLSKDLGGVIKSSLQDLFNTLHGTMNIYKYHNNYYIEAVERDVNSGLVRIANNKIEQICEFGEKTKTDISKFFDVD